MHLVQEWAKSQSYYLRIMPPSKSKISFNLSLGACVLGTTLQNTDSSIMYVG